MVLPALAAADQTHISPPMRLGYLASHTPANCGMRASAEVMIMAETLREPAKLLKDSG